MPTTPARGLPVALENAAARHPAAPRGQAALHQVTLDIAAGEQLAVIGPSGAGKTTLLQVLAASLPPTAGRLRIDGQDPWSLPRRDLRMLRGRLFLAPQVPPLPPRQRVVTAVLAGRLPALGLGRSLRSLFYPDDIPAAHVALDRFDLAPKLFERVDRLSGGERQRVALARALLSPARLWLIDEPLSALDPRHARASLAAIVDEAAQRGITLVCTLHQVERALESFPRIIGLRDGTVAFDLPTAAVTPARLAQLYAQHEDELAGGDDDGAQPLPDWSTATAVPTMMQCR